MSYQVTYTETTNPSKVPLIVADSSLNTQTSITFVGKNYSGYAPIVASNMLHMLENFASPTAPSTPVQGQLWYDNGVGLLKVYDGAGNWNAAGSVKKAGTAPSVAASTAGDLWVDTTNSQLYLFSGSTWLLVGPQFSAGTLTGPQVESIVDTSNISHNVISMYSNNFRIAIISKDSFTPKATVLGFSFINEGFNLSTVNENSATNPTRFYGTATASDALLVNGKIVAAANFLRSDQSPISNVPFSVRSDGGISLGSNLSFNLGTDGSTALIYNKTSGSPVEIKLNNAGVPNTVVHVNPTGRVGIGSNNTSPTSTLDVSGTITTSTGLIDNGTVNSSALGTGSIKTAGGLSIAKNSNFGGTITAFGTITVNNLDITGTPVAATVIQPGSDSATNLYDIGSASRSFRNIYAQSFVGSFNGTFAGSLSGNITGSAARLASPTVFSLTGDVTSNAVSFTGQSALGTAVFTTSINQSLVTSKTVATDSLTTDSLLVFRAGSGLLQMSKQVLFNHVATIPVGTILPYAGATPPTGYLFCDGSEVLIATYAVLYSVLGYTYKAAVLLQGAATFALPDLRGRFALGKDNMNNGLTVPYKDGSGLPVSAGGGTASRVTDITGSTLGSASGTQGVTLTTSNLPDHKHNLSSGSAQYYAGGLSGAAPDPNAIPGLGLPASSTGSGLPNSGSVISSQSSVAVNVMNPYTTINYIIFTGVI
jgi:microcystin-dependent protein